MRRYSIIIYIFIMTLSVISPLRAQEVFSLKEAVGTALRENPEIRAFTWHLEGVRQDEEITKAMRLPRLSLEHRISKTDNPTYAFMGKLNQERFSQSDFAINSLNNPSPVGDFQTEFRFEMPLISPRLTAGIKLSKGMTERENHLFQEKREETALRVLKTYLSVRTARAYREAALKGLQDAEEHRRLAELLYRNGLGLYSDLLRAEVFLKKAQTELEKAEAGLDIARSALGLLMGRTEPVEIDGKLPDFPVNDLDYFINSAMNKDEIRYMKASLKNAERNLSLQKSLLLPEVGIGGSYQINDHRSPIRAEGSSYMAGVFLRWSLFDPTIQPKIKKAEAGLMEAREGLSGLKKAVIFRVKKAYRRVEEKRKNLERAEASVREAEEALKLVRTRYKNSLSPIVDLLDTETLLQKARAERIEAENDLLLSIGELYYQSGILVDYILNDNKDKKEVIK